MLGRTYCALVCLIAASAVQAVKDSSWHNGVETPNVDLPLYWGDMPNLLEDLGNFTKLYVQYHSCAWNQYGGFGDQEDTGRDVEENDYWYMGSMNTGAGWSYAPQISFSLYGVLKGSMRKGCNKRTYINSFYTTSGFYAFSNEIANAGIANNGNDFSLSCQNGVALTCSSSGHGFSFTRFSDKYCTWGNETGEGVPDELAEFNDVLSQATCVEIFDANKGQIPYLLYHSRSCELRDEAGACADPYGRKTLYEKRMLRVLAGLAPDDEKYHRKMVKGYTYLGFGALFATLAVVLAVYEKFFGPRHVLKSKSFTNRELDIEAHGGSDNGRQLRSRSGSGLKTLTKRSSSEVSDIGPSRDNQENGVSEIYSLSTLRPTTLVQPVPAQTQEDGMGCGVKPTLEAVLDHVEEAVANTNIECTSEQNVMACVSMDAGDQILDLDSAPSKASAPEPATSSGTEEGVQKRKSFTLPSIQNALSLGSRGSKVESESSVREIQQPEPENEVEKTQGEAVSPTNMQTAGRIPETLPLSDADGSTKSPKSPKTSGALKKFKKFWK